MRANLRTAAGHDPHDKDLHDLVGELSTRSPEFADRWGAHDVRTHGTGVKLSFHRAVGDLTLANESLDLVAETGLRMTLYSAEPGSPSRSRAEAARLLRTAPQRWHRVAGAAARPHDAGQALTNAARSLISTSLAT